MQDCIGYTRASSGDPRREGRQEDRWRRSVGRYPVARNKMAVRLHRDDLCADTHSGAARQIDAGST
jgi:hypothetical protein